VRPCRHAIAQYPFAPRQFFCSADDAEIEAAGQYDAQWLSLKVRLVLGEYSITDLAKHLVWVRGNLRVLAARVHVDTPLVGRRGFRDC